MEMKLKYALSAALAFTAITGTAHAGAFINGGFEDGSANGWTTGEGNRAGVDNTGLTASTFLPGGSLYVGPATRSSIIGAGTVDPLIGAALGTTTYSGQYSYRTEDTGIGGNASVLSQKVTNYTEANIFFAWKAVLENGGHTENESAELLITLTDDTTGTTLINRIYNAGDGGGGVDGRFSIDGNLYYTAAWQIEQLAIDSSLSGHDFTLSILAADCQPTGHTGYAYIDGFGAVIPPVNVPEPASAALMLLGAGAMLRSRRRKQAK
jgi:hypothetical protein